MRLNRKVSKSRETFKVRDFVNTSCDLCGKSFGIYERLRSHKRTVHAKSKNFVCSICGKAFVTSYKLKRHHNQVHEGQKRKI